KLHQSINGLLLRIEDIDDTLVRPHLELLPRFLVHVGATQNRVTVHGSWQRNWTGNPGSGSLCSLNNVSGGLIKQTVIVSTQTNSDLLTIHSSLTLKQLTCIYL